MDPAVSGAIPMEEILKALDSTDPLVVLLTWSLVYLVRHFASDKFAKVRHILPTLAVLIAVALRAGVEAMAGMEVTWATVTHGIAAGGVAVLFHAQGREIGKATGKEKPTDRVLLDRRVTYRKPESGDDAS